MAALEFEAVASAIEAEVEAVEAGEAAGVVVVIVVVVDAAAGSAPSLKDQQQMESSSAFASAVIAPDWPHHSE